MIKRYIIEADDSLKGFDEAIEKLEREWGAEEIEGSEDCISRDTLERAISELTYWHPTTDGRLEVGGAYDNTVYKVEDVWRLTRVLPSVTPQPKRGKWEVIRKEYEFMGGIVNEPQGCKCSNCGGIVKFKSDFCPNCESYNGGDSECHEDKDSPLANIRYQCEGCVNADDDDGGYNDYMCKTCVRRAKDRYFKL